MEVIYTEAEIPYVAETVLTTLTAADTATVLALQGELGAGKTTLTKAIANILGVKGTVQSPTFVIAKFYEGNQIFKNLVHIDAYRIEDVAELATLGFDRLLQQPKTLIIVEWPERIKSILPKETNWYTISHDNNQRIIKKT